MALYPPVQGPPPPPYTQHSELVQRMSDLQVASLPRAGDTPLLTRFTEGNVVVLESKSSGKTLRSLHGQAQGIGGRGKHAQWKVHVRRPAVIALQNIASPEHWLGIHDNQTIGNGGGDTYSEFIVAEANEHHVVFESVQYPGKHVGVLPDGTIKPPGRTGIGNHAQFLPCVHTHAHSPPTTAVALTPSAPPLYTLPPPQHLPHPPPPPQHYPPPPQHHPHHPPPPHHHSHPHPHHHPHPPPQHHPHPYPPPPPHSHPPPHPHTPPPPPPPPAPFQPGTVCPQYYLPYGNHDYQTPHTCSSDSNVTLPAGYPENQAPPSSGCPGQPPLPLPSGYTALTNYVYQTPGAGFPGNQTPPTSTAPVAQSGLTGYNVMDAFQEGNVLQLVCRTTSRPLALKPGSVSGSGNYIYNDSQFTVVIPNKVTPGVVMLQNGCQVELYVAIRNSKVCVGRGGRFCHFRVHVLPNDDVCLESVQFSGCYVAIAFNSTAFPCTGRNDNQTHFFVRVERQKSTYSQTIMTAFGRPAIANKLSDRSIVQLYLKSSSTYLSINSNGHVAQTTNPGNKQTFLELVDRGMGVVSLHSYLYPGCRLRVNNSVVEGKGDPDKSADWRLKENADRTLQFESVTSPGVNVCIAQCKDLHIFLLNFNRDRSSETIIKTPLN